MLPAIERGTDPGNYPLIVADAFRLRASLRRRNPPPSSYSTALPQAIAVQEPKAEAMGHWLRLRVYMLRDLECLPLIGSPIPAGGLDARAEDRSGVAGNSVSVLMARWLAVIGFFCL